MTHREQTSALSESTREGLTEGNLEAGKRADGTPFGIPYLVAKGSKEGPVICIDAAIHGDETDGSLAVVQLLRELTASELNGTVVGVPVLNMPAAELAQRAASPNYEIFVYDMNRIMPGQPNSSTTKRLANLYWQNLASHADYVISLHGGGTQQYRSPRVIYQQQLPESLDLAKAMGSYFAVYQPGIPEAGSTEKACAEQGIPCVIVEFGGNAARMPEVLTDVVERIVSGLRNVLRGLDVLDGEAEVIDHWTFVEGGHSIWTTHGGLLRPLPSLRMNTRVNEGTPLLEVIDLFGNVVEVISAPWNGVVLGFKSTIYARPGDIVCSVGKIGRSAE